MLMRTNILSVGVGAGQRKECPFLKSSFQINCNCPYFIYACIMEILSFSFFFWI